jgi:hypothetical protein
MRAAGAAVGAMAVALWLPVAAALAAPAGGAQPLTGSEILSAQPPGLAEKLLKRHIVLLQEFGMGPEAFGGFVRALVIFEQPRDSTMRLLIQASRQREYRDDVSDIEVIGQSPKYSVSEYHMRMMLMNIVYRLRYDWDFDTFRIQWALAEEFDNDLSDVSGFWELFELDGGRTLGRFGTRIDVGPHLPKFLQDYATRKNLPRALDRVRRWVDSGGTWRP